MGCPPSLTPCKHPRPTSAFAPSKEPIMKLYWASLVTAAVAATSLSAYAGVRWSWPVFVNKNTDGSGNMGGMLGATRNSPDTTNYLVCYYDAYAAGWKSGMCYGYNGKVSAG